MIKEVELVAGTDLTATKAKTKKFLGNYDAFRLLVSSSFQPKVTQTYSVELTDFSGGEKGNPLDSFIIKQEAAKEKLDKMFRVLNSLESDHRVLLVSKYIDKRYRYDFEIMNFMGVAETRYYEILGDALIAFAFGYGKDLVVEVEE